MYATVNFKTKKALKEAVANGDKIGVYQPNNMFNTPPMTNGTCCVEMPHYPEPHRAYAEVTVKDGYIIKVK